MTGGEIVAGKAAIAAGKAAKDAAEEALGSDEAEKRQLLELSKDSPAMQAAADAYAQRVAVKQAILLKLYRPLGALLGIRRAYFEDQFALDLAEKVSEIPEEHIATPPSSIALPAMQGLAFSLDEPDLKEMYLKLLAAASDDRRPYDAHPSFAQIIRELSSREAKLLRWCLSTVQQPIARIKLMKAPNSWLLVLKHNVVNWPAETPPALADDLAVRSAYVDNWVRLGLVEVSYTEQLIYEPPLPDPYAWVEQRPDYPTFAPTLDESGKPQPWPKVTFDRGILRVTDFGQRFLRAIS
ncbi:MAG TPA: DUF4393 domain-containing protein [Acidimicrobiales bacterium]|nr:DUF4393 domain-containing protein [Acidimicrobiales bacterium]